MTQHVACINGEWLTKEQFDDYRKKEREISDEARKTAKITHVEFWTRDEDGMRFFEVFPRWDDERVRNNKDESFLSMSKNEADGFVKERYPTAKVKRLRG